MSESKDQQLSSISKANSYERIGEYWDKHSLVDHWDETVEAEFDIRAERQHRIAIDPDVFEHLEKEARIQGIVPERLLNKLLSERLGLAK